MKTHIEPLATVRQSRADTARPVLRHVLLPEKIYEALPAAYVSIGMLIILGAVYIGIGHGPMIGYLGLGVTCIFAGLTVNGMRRRARSSIDTGE